jgi:hypothetical protein
MVRSEKLHFSYCSGPSYVEWIDDYSCAVVFQDEVSSLAAISGLSAEEERVESLEVEQDGDKNTEVIDIGTEETDGDGNENPHKKFLNWRQCTDPSHLSMTTKIL